MLRLAERLAALPLAMALKPAQSRVPARSSL
jgi:hypothetical protein